MLVGLCSGPGRGLVQALAVGQGRARLAHEEARGLRLVRRGPETRMLWVRGADSRRIRVAVVP